MFKRGAFTEEAEDECFRHATQARGVSDDYHQRCLKIYQMN
jgi:hypothetical protein